MFQLTREEAQIVARLRSQNATIAKPAGNRPQTAAGSQKHRDPRFLPYAFTEHGAIQAANVLNSDAAIEMSVQAVQLSFGANHCIVVGVRANPHPAEPVRDFDRKSAVGRSDADGPQCADFLKMERWMSGIRQPQPVILSGEFLNGKRQSRECPPKSRSRRGFHPTVWFFPAVDRLGLRARENRGDPLSRRPRFGDPKGPHAARATDRSAREIPRSEASRWLLRFPERCSCPACCFNGAALSSGEKGAALKRVRSLSLHKPGAARETASTGPRSRERGDAKKDSSQAMCCNATSQMSLSLMESIFIIKNTDSKRAPLIKHKRIFLWRLPARIISYPKPSTPTRL